MRVQLTKPRLGSIGITLEGNRNAQYAARGVEAIAMAALSMFLLRSHSPVVTSSNRDELTVGDIVAAVNGRPTDGAVLTARMIKRAHNVELEIWRPTRHLW